ncbi:hypothetical protein ACFPQ1_37640, partial [Rhodocytophaga aerolata]
FDQFYRNWQLEYIDDAIEGFKQFGDEAFIRLAQVSKQCTSSDRIGQVMAKGKRQMSKLSYPNLHDYVQK